MPDTGLPWEIPYAAPADLVRDWPALSEDVADAVAAGLSAAGGLVAVKHALFTGTQTNSTAAGGNFAVTDLSITHEVADAANRLILYATFGAVSTSASNTNAGIGIYNGSAFLSLGATVGSRTSVGGAGALLDSAGGVVSTVAVHTPGAGSVTYVVHAFNVSAGTRTVNINRGVGDSNDGSAPRAASSLTLLEVKV
jgi:hypothetical protein